MKMPLIQTGALWLGWGRIQIRVSSKSCKLLVIHLPSSQPLDPLGDGRMRGKQAGEEVSNIGLHDKKMCRGRRRRQRHALGIGIEFLERSGQRVRIAGKVGARLVRRV